MSDTPAISTSIPIDNDAVDIPVAAPAKSFLKHAKLIGGLTLISRLVGLAREVVAGHYLGTGVVASAFTVAFTIPNLFRKLLGEGALSVAFIPLYAQALKRGRTESGESPEAFAAGSVNLLVLILAAITVIGEAILIVCILRTTNERPDRILMLKFAAVMLPYVMLVCGGAFLSAILQVHKRFGPPAFAPVILNVCHIGVVVIGASILGLHGRDAQTPHVVQLQTTLAFWLALAVLVAGALQVAILLPALRQVGFRFHFGANFRTAAVRKMLLLSVPVAMGAGVLQLSVLLDKGLSYGLMQGVDKQENRITTFTMFNRVIRYPMELGATRRLDLAQLLYQFPLGVFAIALATAIFPNLSAEALDRDGDNFRRVLRQGISATLWEGLPASAGLILVAGPATRLLFQHGQITPHDADLIASSTRWYAGAIWAFSLLQIINRAYYAVHDTITPLTWSIVNIIANLVVEIPLLWWLGEAGMAVGTLVSFMIQAVVMLWMLDRRLGGLQLSKIRASVFKMIAATIAMVIACLLVERMPGYPKGISRSASLGQLLILMCVGGAVYGGLCVGLGVEGMASLLPRRLRSKRAT